MHNKYTCLLICLVSFCSISSSEIDFFELSLEELFQLEIATKHKQTIYSSPSSVYVVTRQQIKAMGIDNLQTLLNFVPGFQSTRDVEQGTANRISARGRSTALSESVLVQINGKKINDLYTGGISIINRLLDIGNVEQIEIIRGPGSALYGSNAFLGVINIVTLSGHNEVNLSVGSNGTISSNVLFSTSWSKSHQLDLYLSTHDDRGHSYEITDLYGINANVKDPVNGSDIYLRYAFDHWLFSSRYMQRQLEDFIALGSIGNDVNNEKTKQWSASAEYQRQTSESFSYDFSIFHTKDRWQTIALLIPKSVEIAPEFSLSNDFIGGPFLTSQTSKATINFNYQTQQAHLLSVGASFENAKITDVYTSTTHDLFTLEEYDTARTLTGEQSFNVKKSRDISSIYLQDQWHISDRWELTTGVRYDKYNDFGSSTSPRLALVFKPKNKSSLKLMYGTAFRAPNFLELYDRNNYVDFGNINLNAEKVETIEISWLTALSNWHFEITAFNNKFENLIRLGEPVDDPNNPFFAPSFTNNNGQSSRGVETELQFKVNTHLNVKLFWNWLTSNSDINTGRSSGAFIVDFQRNRLQVNLHSFYRSSNKAIDNQGGYMLTSSNIRYQIAPKLKVNLQLSNLFDKHYKTQSILYNEGIENRGRDIRFGIEYQF